MTFHPFDRHMTEDTHISGLQGDKRMSEPVEPTLSDEFDVDDPTGLPEGDS